MPKVRIKDMLKWIDAQRDVVNTLINVAPPDRKDQYMPELYVINAIAERLQEMTAVEYFRAKEEMCDSDWNAVSCKRCELRGSCDNRGCVYFEQASPRLSVEIVKKWKEEQDESTNRV